MRINCTKTKKTDWHEDKQLDTKTKKNRKKPTLSVINAGPTDTQTILVFTWQEKKSTETHKKPQKYVNFDLLAGKILTGY